MRIQRNGGFCHVLLYLTLWPLVYIFKCWLARAQKFDITGILMFPQTLHGISVISIQLGHDIVLPIPTSHCHLICEIAQL
jgi:hypothetical protein